MPSGKTAFKAHFPQHAWYTFALIATGHSLGQQIQGVFEPVASALTLRDSEHKLADGCQLLSLG